MFFPWIKLKAGDKAMSKVPSSFDARDWADEFCLIAKEKFGLDIDNGWMIGWFANAIMRGYDKRESQIEKLRKACKKAYDFVDDEFNNKIIVEMDGSFGLHSDLGEALGFLDPDFIKDSNLEQKGDINVNS